jgi:hypothetical protein
MPSSLCATFGLTSSEDSLDPPRTQPVGAELIMCVWLLPCWLLGSRGLHVARTTVCFSFAAGALPTAGGADSPGSTDR